MAKSEDHGTSRRYATKLYAVILAIIAAILLAGGVKLAGLGGSIYYAAAGLAVAASAFFIWRGRALGAWIYAAMLGATLLWAVWEVGLDGWALAPRIIAPAVLGLALLLPPLRRELGFTRGRMIANAGLAAALLVAVTIFLWRGEPYVEEATRIMPSSVGSDRQWIAYGGTNAGLRHSELTQITPANVRDLEVAWTFRVGPSPNPSIATSLQTTPLMIDDTLYLCTGYNDVIALDAASGKERWRFHAKAVEGQTYRACRGVAYVATPSSSQCPARIVTNTVDARLIALDPRTGKGCADFGENGEVSLLRGLGHVDKGYYYVTSAPTVVRGRIVLGGWVTDGQYWGEPSGVVRAFDAVTGQLAWAWDMGRPDRTGEPPEGESYTRGTPNAWAPMSADDQLGLVYVPTGISVPDYYGAQRRPFDDAYSSSVVAIDVETGRPRWHFQTGRHDLWDYDVASQPTLFDLPIDGRMRHGLIQPTKRGQYFVLDRVTGEPIMPVADKPVPTKGAAPGERVAPTQPFSVAMPSFGDERLTERSMWGVTPLDQLWCRIAFREARYEGTMTPPGLTPSIASPGYYGGSDWGSVSIDPARGLMIVNSVHVTNYNKLIPRVEADRRRVKPIGETGEGDTGGMLPQMGTPFAADIRPFLSPIQVPCQAPPYGKLSAVDLTNGKIRWSRPLGTPRDSGPWGIGSGLDIVMGVPNAGGSINTATGLTFIGATQDQYLRAFSTASGKLLWRGRLPAGGQATPMTYMDRNGRQIVLIAAGGHPSFRTRIGDYIIAYALPAKR